MWEIEFSEKGLCCRVYVDYSDGFEVVTEGYGSSFLRLEFENGLPSTGYIESISATVPVSVIK